MKNHLPSVLLILIALAIHPVFAQIRPVSITITVTPPYSSRIQDYINQPNKIMATITSRAHDPLNVYLQGSVAAEGGIRVNTNPAYRGPMITLLPRTPYRITQANLQDVFDPNHLVYTGITKQQIMNGSGLPEGNYIICLKAYNANNELVSEDEPQACSNSFPIADIEPPAITSMKNDDVVIAKNPQQVVFNWTWPSGGPHPTNFLLKIVELLPSDKTPDDAMNSTSHPVFFSVTTNNSFYFLNSTDPLMVTGKKYAVCVIASDPANRVIFRNNGRSEVVRFSYDALMNPVVGTTQGSGQPGIIHNIPRPPMTSYAHGTLLYTYDDKKELGPFPLENCRIKLIVKYTVTFPGQEPVYLGHDPAGNESMFHDGDVLDVTTTGKGGSFLFTFQSNDSLGYQIGRDYTCTDNYGQTRHDGLLYRKMLIMIDGPLKEFILSRPDFGLSYTNLPGQQTEMQSLLPVDVKSYQLTVNLYTAFANNQNPGNNGATLKKTNMSGANVYLLRKVIADPTGIFPPNDGYPKPKARKTMFNLEVVAEDVADAGGNVIFNAIVWHHNPNYTYYIYADLPKEESANYTLFPDAPVPYDPSPLTRKYPDPSTYNDYDKFHNDYGWIPLNTYLLMHCRYPTIMGEVTDENGKALPGAVVDLIERFSGQQGWHAETGSVFMNYGSYSYNRDEYVNFVSKFSMDLKNGPVFDGDQIQEVQTSDGRFRFDDMALILSPVETGSGTEYQAEGPSRKVWAYCHGYASPPPYTIKGGQALLCGEKANIPIKLSFGATIKGRVVDGETSDGIYCDIAFVDAEKSYHPYMIGCFKDIPAKLLPNVQQKLKISAKDYIDTIITVNVNNKETDVGTIQLFKQKRRMVVFVYGKTGNAPQRIPGAVVEIMGVTYPCTRTLNGHPVTLDCPLTMLTDNYGSAKFEFVNAGYDQEQDYSVRVAVPDDSPLNYETQTVNVKIPVSQNWKLLNIYLDPATCISGHVYAGKTDSSAVANARVYLEVTYSGQNSSANNGDPEIVSATTDSKGFYKLHNVPMRDYRQILRAVKSSSNFIGDSVSMTLNNPYPDCYHVDLHLKVYDRMDITNLMGFPMYVTSLTEEGGGMATITGAFSGMKSNLEFLVSPSLDLHFVRIKIKPSEKLKNKRGIPLSTPVSLPVKTTTNTMAAKAFAKYNVLVMDKKIGIDVDKATDKELYGAIKGMVKLDNKNFNSSGFTFPKIFLAQNDQPGKEKLSIPVLNGDSNLVSPNGKSNGFYVCDTLGKSLVYSLPGFTNAAMTSNSKSFLKPDALVLNTTLHTIIPTDVPGETISVDLGDLKFTKNNDFAVNGKSPINIKMGTWTLNSEDWKMTTSGFTLNHSVIKTGADVNCDTIRMTYYDLNTEAAVVKMDNLGIPGGYAIQVPRSPDVSTGLAREVISGSQNRWRIYASTLKPSAVAGFIEGLPAMENNNRINLSMIRFFSDGSQDFVVKEERVRLNKIVDFKPNAGSMLLRDQSLKFGGLYYLGVPNGDTTGELFTGGDCEYNLVNGKLQFNEHSRFETIHFTRHHVNYHFEVSDFSNQNLVAKGAFFEPKVLPSVNATFTKNSAGAVVNIDPHEKIAIAETGTVRYSKYISELTGQIKVVNNKWDTLWYEGELTGLKGISEHHSRVKFKVTGEVIADDQKIEISGLSSVPGLKLTYEFDKSRLTGEFHQEIPFGPYPADCYATMVVDGGGWYFELGGNLQVPILPGLLNATGEFYGILGDYQSVPPTLAGKFGSYKCLPPSFQDKISGFLLQGGLGADVLPGIDYNLILSRVRAGIELGGTERFWMSFNDVNNYGVSMLAHAKIYASGYNAVTCTTVDAHVDFDFGLTGQYQSSGLLSFDGCASTSVGITGTQCLGLYGTGICCGSAGSKCCATVNLIQFTIGAIIKYSCNLKAGTLETGDLGTGYMQDVLNSSRIDFSVTRNTCSEYCP